MRGQGQHKLVTKLSMTHGFMQKKKVVSCYRYTSVLSTRWLPFLTPFRELISVPGQFDLAFGPCVLYRSICMYLSMQDVHWEMFGYESFRFSRFTKYRIPLEVQKSFSVDAFHKEVQNSMSSELHIHRQVSLAKYIHALVSKH